eukprot:12184054-Karenia_brevis.AAC.1
MAGCMSPEHALVYKDPIPSGNLLEGVYIDDHIIFHVLKKNKRCAPEGPDVDLLNTSRRAYKEAGFELSSDKSFGVLDPPPNTSLSSHLSSFVAWGTEVITSRGTAATPQNKRGLLVRVAAHILVLPAVP